MPSFSMKNISLHQRIQLIKKTLTDIVNEEKLHVGQLFGLLFMLDPASKEQFEKGLNEFTQDIR